MRPVAAGCVAGLAFASKQNVGGLALLALIAVLVVGEPVRVGVRHALAATASFAVVAGATVSAMVASGGFQNALDSLGLGKGAYLELGAVPYHDVLVKQLAAIFTADAWVDAVTGRGRDLLNFATPKTLLPVVTGALLVAAWFAWARRGPRPRHVDVALLTITSFALAGFLAAYPRYDPAHLAYIGGVLVVACAVALTFVSPALGPTVRALLLATALVSAALVVYGPLHAWNAGSRVPVGLPHFASIWTSPDDQARASASARELQRALPGRRVFIVSGSASFYYLAAGLENPTRFDYPASTTVGPDDVTSIVRAVTHGSVAAVCLVDGPADSWSLRPSELERRLRLVMRPGRDVGLCRLWHPRTARPLHARTQDDHAAVRGLGFEARSP
jgi:hypothetical protein